MGKRVLVTGGAGFIGSFLVEELLRRGYEVRVYDSLDPQVHPERIIPPYLPREVEFIRGDIRDYQRLSSALEGVQVVSHHAAAVGVGQSQYLVKHYVDVNLGGTGNLLNAVAANPQKVERMIIASSMSIYGEGRCRCRQCGEVTPRVREDSQMRKGDWELHCPLCGEVLEPIPTDEKAETRCSSIYAITKKAQEEMMMNVGLTYRIPTVALRYFNAYGPRQSLSNPYTGVCAIFLSRIKNDRAPVIYEDGSQSRDFVSIHDVVQAHMLALEKEEADFQVFNVGTGEAVGIKEVAAVLLRLYGKTITPQIANRYRKGDIRHCFSDISKIKRLLGFQPKVSFEDGMKELIEWSKRVGASDRFDMAAQELRDRGLVLGEGETGGL